MYGNCHLPYTIYLFDTKYLLLHLVVGIDVLDWGHLENETVFSVARPFLVAAFPMDQGYNKKRKTNIEGD